MISMIDKKGLQYVCRDQTCFGFMKCDELFTKQVLLYGTSDGTSVSSITHISYTPDLSIYTQEYKDIADQYIKELLDTDYLNEIAPFVDKRTRTVTLPINSLSGTEMIAIFSLFRYTAMYPTVILDTMHMSEYLDFDKALYLAHFLELTADIGKYEYSPNSLEWCHYIKPLNHGVVPQELRAGGHTFLVDGFERAHSLPPFDKTHSYANIQGIVGSATGQPLPYETVMSDSDIKLLASNL